MRLFWINLMLHYTQGILYPKMQRKIQIVKNRLEMDENSFITANDVIAAANYEVQIASSITFIQQRKQFIRNVLQQAQNRALQGTDLVEFLLQELI